MSAQSVKELQKQQRELQQQLEQTSNMLKQTQQNEKATVNKLNILNNDIKTRKKLINNIQSEISGLNVEMEQLRDKRSELQLELEACKAEYAHLVRETHYADLQQSPLLFLLSSASLSVYRCASAAQVVSVRGDTGCNRDVCRRGTAARQALA